MIDKIHRETIIGGPWCGQTSQSKVPDLVLSNNPEDVTCVHCKTMDRWGVLA